MISQGNKIKLRNILVFILVGSLFGLAYNYLFYLHNLVGLIEAISVCVLCGILIGITQEFILKSKFKDVSFYKLLLLRVIIYSSIVTTILFLVLSIKISFDEEISYVEAMIFYSQSSLFKRDFLFGISLVFTAIFLTQIIQLIGIRNLGRLIAGKYHKPKEIRRIFMFIDLNDSTSLAERLGDERYSSFIREYFNDISDAINMYSGEIYQYVGDEISVVWSIKKKNNHCLNCFFEAQKIIYNKRDQYIEMFGIVPTFKAGAHVGTVVLTEVGKLKKSLVYHGDVVNTTSRIIGKCNELNQEFLISKNLLTLIDNTDIDIAEQGELLLKGKARHISLYGIQKHEAVNTPHKS